jgi:transcriptional regulator of arginine metabolism
MKNDRQAKIYELIRTREIETQGELTELLKEAGFDVTQATVSRDIHEMKLTKLPSTSGGHKYASATPQDEQDMARLNRVFRDGLVSIDFAGNLLVIRTFNGMAMAVAAALDAMRFPEIVGSIAGDDVVMCVVKTQEQAVALMEKLKK